MKRISAAFASIFCDDEWFNKVLVGGLYVFFYPFLIGMIMVMGFQIEFARKLLNNESGMPLWRNSKHIFRNGIRSFSVSLFYAAITLLILILLHIPLLSLTTLAVMVSVHLFMNPVIIDLFSRTDSIVRCINPLTLFGTMFQNVADYGVTVVITTLMIAAAVLLGWMWIIVGWTLLVFLTLLVQTSMFAR